MTEQRPAGGPDGAVGASDQRAERLAALLSVDISRIETARGLLRARTVPSPAEPAGAREEEAGGEPPDGGPDGTASRTPGAMVPPWRTAVSFGVLFALIAAGVGLAYAGTRILRDSTEGEAVAQVTDPAAPGFEALVEATPTMVLFHDRGDGLDSITVLTLPDPDGVGGGVILVPRRTVVELPVFGQNPVEVAYDLGDVRVGAEGVGLLLGAAMGESQVLDDERWATLVDPVAPLVIDNPNPLEIDGELAFPVGEIELRAQDVGPYLAASEDGESDLARLFRHRLVWEAWLDAVAADGSTGAVPGEIESGIGRFVRAIAAGEAIIETLPVEPASAPFGEETAFVAEGEAVTGLVRTLVPFPLSPAPGLRARTRVLNGTADTSRAMAVAADLTPAGIEVVLVGNAQELDAAETTVRYLGDEFRDEAERIVDLLGVGEVLVEDRPSDVVDITVTLGADYE